MEQIKAPFTEEQVKALNKYQFSGAFHPFTCRGQVRVVTKGQAPLERSRDTCPNEGILIATESGWQCPCKDSECNQDWAWRFMTENIDMYRIRDGKLLKRKEGYKPYTGEYEN